MAYEYFPSVSYQTILEKRPHSDKFLTEVAIMAGSVDIDVADLLREDINSGNTATLRKMYTFVKKENDFAPWAMNGSIGGDYQGGAIVNQTFYGSAPIKDDYSAALGGGYESLPDTDARKKQVERYIKAHNLKLADLDEAIINPKDIPPFLDANGNENPKLKEYRNRYDNSPDLQAEYPTFFDYRNSLVTDLNEQRKNIKDISDIYVSTAVLGNTFEEENMGALYFTMANIYPQVKFWGQNAKKREDWPAQNYSFELVFGVGQFAKTSVICGWKSWSHIIRTGVVKDKFDTGGKVKYKRHKSTYRLMKNGGQTILASNGEPIVQVLQANVDEGSSQKDMLEIQCQLTPTTYGEIRVWGYGSLHGFTGNSGKWRGVYASLVEDSLGFNKDIFKNSIDLPDGATTIIDIDGHPQAIGSNFKILPELDAVHFSIDAVGVVTANAPLNYTLQKDYYIKVAVQCVMPNNPPWDDGANYSKTVLVSIHLQNTNNVPEPAVTPPAFGDESENDGGADLCYFPLEYKACKKIPLFRRERLLRECVVLGVYSVKKVKLKWYQTGIFKVVIWIIAIVFAWVTGGQSLNVAVLITQAITLALKYLVTLIIKMFLESIIDAPWLLAALTFVYAVYNQDFSKIKFDELADLAMDGMKVAINVQESKLQSKMEELKEEMEAFKEKARQATEEMDALMEEAGTMLSEDGSAAIKFMIGLARVETADDTINRTLNLDNALITSSDNQLNLDKLLNTF